MLQLRHVKEYEQANESQSQQKLDGAVAIFRQQKASVKKLPPSDAFQQKFNRLLVEMIAVDGLPMCITDGLGFQRLMGLLKPELNLISRRTVARILEDMAKKHVKPSVAKAIESAPDGGLHFIVDMWSSRRRDAILGVKVQFVQENWELVTMTLAFKYFPARHTGENIREAFQDILREHCVALEKVGAVVCDNASNMTKAFDMTELFPDMWHRRDEAGDEIEVLASDVDVADAVVLSRRVRCAAHTLQLAVNAAIKADSDVSELLRTVSKVVNIFRRSPTMTSSLKENCGKDLVPIGGTRWNSIVAALQRLSQVCQLLYRLTHALLIT